MADESQTLSQFLRARELDKGRMKISKDLSYAIQEAAAVGIGLSHDLRGIDLKGGLGSTGKKNVSGEIIQKPDRKAHEDFCNGLGASGCFWALGSEEDPDVIPIPTGFTKGEFVGLFDPLDGSSNTDANINVGSILSFHRKVSNGSLPSEEDLLQPGKNQIFAGFFLYGFQTKFVFTTGQGVHIFTLAPDDLKLRLVSADFKIPLESKNVYSINERDYNRWEPGTRAYIDYLKEEDSETNRPYSARYIGSLVADFYRTLVYGGIFMYPAAKKPGKELKPKLRLLYELAPLAWIMEQAGGMASTGRESILDIVPTELHQREAIIMGSRSDVQKYIEIYSGTPESKP